MRETPSVQKVAIKQQATKLNNMLSQSLTQGQVELLKLGLQFTPVPKFDLNTMENDQFAFIVNLRLIYHFTVTNQNKFNPDESLLKRKLTCTKSFPKTKNLKIQSEFEQYFFRQRILIRD